MVTVVAWARPVCVKWPLVSKGTGDVWLEAVLLGDGCAGLAEEPCMGQWQPKELLELCPGGAALC